MAGGKVTYSASASKGKVSVSAACGGASGSCETPAESTCNGEFKAASTGGGTCSIADASWGVDEGTASCAGSTPKDGEVPPKCIIEILGICVPNAGSVDVPQKVDPGETPCVAGGGSLKMAAPEVDDRDTNVEAPQPTSGEGC